MKRWTILLVALCSLPVTLWSSSMPSDAATRTVPWYQPLLSLPSRATVLCILTDETHSTLAVPNTSDHYSPYQYGPFQFTTVLWNRWAWVAGVGAKTRLWYRGSTSLNAVTIPAYKATLYQQAKVFAVVARNDGLWPWTNFDGC